MAWAGSEHVGSAVEHGEAGGANGERARAGVSRKSGENRGVVEKTGRQKLIGPFVAFCVFWASIRELLKQTFFFCELLKHLG